MNMVVYRQTNNNFIEAEVDKNQISLLLKDINGNVEKQYQVEKDRW